MDRLVINRQHSSETLREGICLWGKRSSQGAVATEGTLGTQQTSEKEKIRYRINSSLGENRKPNSTEGRHSWTTNGKTWPLLRVWPLPLTLPWLLHGATRENNAVNNPPTPAHLTTLHLRSFKSHLPPNWMSRSSIPTDTKWSQPL